MEGARPVLMATIVLALASAGCGEPAGALLAPVHGTVTYRGEPVTGGVIVFVPDASRGSDGPLATGEIGPDGGYHLDTGKTAGAAGGWYRVTVAAVDRNALGADRGVPHSLLPEKYRDPELSGLICEVKPGRANTLNFRLE
jgi:hypothetical protein